MEVGGENGLHSKTLFSDSDSEAKMLQQHTVVLLFMAGDVSGLIEQCSQKSRLVL